MTRVFSITSLQNPFKTKMVCAKYNLLFIVIPTMVYLFLKFIPKFPSNEPQAPDLIFSSRLGPLSAKGQKPLCILSAWHMTGRI